MQIFRLRGNSSCCTQSVKHLHGIPQACCVRWHRHPVSAIAAHGFIEVLSPGDRGNMMDKDHVGKMVIYLTQMLREQTTRVKAMGILTDARHAALYIAERNPDGTASYSRTQAFEMVSGDCTISLLLASYEADW